MDGWELGEVDSEGITVGLNIAQPIAVSQGDNPDLVLLQLDLGDYKSASGV